MSSTRRAVAVLAITAAGALVGPNARAADAGEIAGQPATLDVTNTAIGAYHFNNRNSSPTDPATRVDDNYGEFLDRLNVQLGVWRLRFGVRLDTATYFHTTSNATAHDLASADVDALAKTAPRISLNSKTNDYYRELNTRFLQTFYPSKLFINYTAPNIDLTVGDFYAQLGRGLVFSVRKIDELAIDTTVRGGKLVLDHTFGDVQVGLTAFVGQLNPLRIDESTGRRLNGTGSPLFFGFPQGNNFQYWSLAEPSVPGSNLETPVSNLEKAKPNYLEDTVYGGHAEVGNSTARLGANASLLRRTSYTAQNLACRQQCAANDAVCQDSCAAQFPDFAQTDASRLHNTIRTFSGSLSFPSIAKLADAYVEVAGQQLRDGHLRSDPKLGNVPEADLSGYAIYANVNVHKGPVTLSLEGKHYRSFFPLSANIDLVSPGYRAPEFSVINYNQVPTAEPIYVEQIGSPNNCMTGGRAQLDYRFAPRVLSYVWLGRYTSWTEYDPTNNLCDRRVEASTGKSTTQTNTWDGAVGTQLGFDGGRSHVFAWIGARLTDLEVPEQASGNVPAGLAYGFYREGYIRYDIVKHLTGPFSVQFQGFHRHRYQPQEFQPWNEGENYTALQWSPHLAAIFGYEYLAKDGCQPQLDPTLPHTKFCNYFSGGLQWRSAQTDTVLKHFFDTVNLFVGQRRGAIRCVSGVCRQFPPFEGARLEIVSRF